jgi:ectoine hydroxylase-related dioxygenase (phytanoyl-CoA dioxygenase family)
MKSISSADGGRFRLDETEQQALDEQGYIVREEVFAAADVRAMIAASEALVDDLVRDRQGWRLHVGSYVFDPDVMNGVIIKWEGDSHVVHGIEPFAHLSPVLREWALDARLVEPMIDLVGHDRPELFTEKLNLKRPTVGGPNPPHQDYPYWIDSAEVAADVATAMLLLDDATVANGCLRVAPGSHRSGKWTTRTDGDVFLANEIDMNEYTDVELTPLELGAGSVVMFGPFLVHQSLPNHSDAQRRALLFSYQPAGRHHMLAMLQKTMRGEQ